MGSKFQLTWLTGGLGTGACAMYMSSVVSSSSATTNSRDAKRK